MRGSAGLQSSTTLAGQVVGNALESDKIDMMVSNTVTDPAMLLAVKSQVWNIGSGSRCLVDQSHGPGYAAVIRFRPSRMVRKK